VAVAAILHPFHLQCGGKKLSSFSGIGNIRAVCSRRHPTFVVRGTVINVVVSARLARFLFWDGSEIKPYLEALIHWIGLQSC
jgi:hypothetical protein